MKIMGIVNQKGGVGKTTTAVHLAAGLAARGKNVCLIDLDPQGNASNYLGYVEGDEDVTISNLILDYANRKPINASLAIRRNEGEELDYIASNVLLSSAEFMLTNCMAREKVLSNILKAEVFAQYDYVIIDCLPSLGILMINALCAATDVLIPVQCQKFSMVALDQLYETIYTVQTNLNENLRVLGILPTMRNHTVMSREVIEAIHARGGAVTFKTAISALNEAVTSSYDCKSLVRNDKSVIGEQYRELVSEVLLRHEV